MRPGGIRRFDRLTRTIGFTIVELLVVMLIIAVVIGFLLPLFSSVSAINARILCATNLHQLGIAVISYGADSFGDLPTHFGGGNPPIDTFWMRKDSKKDEDDPVNLGMVTDYVSNPKTFYCVTQSDSPDIAQNASNNSWRNGKGPKGGGLNSSYVARTREDPEASRARWALHNHANKVIYTDFVAVDGWPGQGRFKGRLDAPHGASGCNRLFGDGSNSWAAAAPLNALRPITKKMPKSDELFSYFKLLDVLP